MEKNIRILRETEGEAGFRVQPKDIRLARDGSRGGLGKDVLDHSFGRLVHFFQHKKKCWAPFTLEELITHYDEQHWDLNLMLVGLLGTWYNDRGSGSLEPEGPYIVMFPEGNWAVTEAFVEVVEWDRRKGPDA